MGMTRTSRPGRVAGVVRTATLLVVLVAVVAACSSTDSGSTDATPSTPVAPDPSSAANTTGTTPAGAFTLTSSAFAEGEAIPLRYACVNQGGENASPPLAWSGVPDDTETLILVVHDPDAPIPGGFTHLVTTIPTDVSSVDDGANLTGEGPMAMWIGPCPPSGEHHYVFTLLAFGPGGIAAGADKAAIEAAKTKAIGEATLTGVFAHQS